MSYSYSAPADTSRVLQEHADQCLNAGLTLARYVPKQVIDVEVKHYDDRGKERGTERNFWLQELCRRSVPNNNIRVLIANAYERWKATTKGAVRFSMESRSRLIVGLGGTGVLEFGITLHPVTGLPFIPGSALKGICRSYALYYIAEQSGIALDPAEIKDPSERVQNLDEQLVGIKNHKFPVHPEYATLYRNLFGTQESAGQCMFFDAVIQEIPEGTSIFVTEVMTPHFPDYYRSDGRDAPHDGGNPTPVLFVAVNTGIVFKFAIGLRRNSSLDKGILGDARQWLKSALQELGIGAKTAAGYGVFGDPSSLP